MIPNQGYAGSPSVGKVQEQPILMDCAKRINSRLHDAHEAATRIENVIDRILNPTPRPTGADAPKPSPNTIESLLNETDGTAQGLSQRLHALAERLERAA